LDVGDRGERKYDEHNWKIGKYSVILDYERLV
jgi:hypothetical protein